MNKLLDNNLTLTEESMQKILEHSSTLDCECPKHLIEILNKVKNFKKYEQSCINKNDQDKETHEWLYDATENIEQMISTTIVQLARIENMIDENNDIIPHKNSK
jgi:hypothetical protein